MVNTGIPFFNICVLSFLNKKLHYNRADQQFFHAPCNRVTSSLQKRKQHKYSAIICTKTCLFCSLVYNFKIFGGTVNEQFKCRLQKWSNKFTKPLACHFRKENRLVIFFWKFQFEFCVSYRRESMAQTAAQILRRKRNMKK